MPNPPASPRSAIRAASLSMLFVAAVSTAASATQADDASSSNIASSHPNIVVFLADDLGYGDLSCYGATAISLPNIHRLAAEGQRFTSGYCSASTCTPTRYSFLTGRYAFRDPGTGIAQLDWCVGELLETLDQLSLTEKTLVVFCSDNGPVLDDGYKDDAIEKIGDHDANGPFRGGKYNVYEGGTRTPGPTRRHWPNLLDSTGQWSIGIFRIPLWQLEINSTRLRKNL